MPLIIKKQFRFYMNGAETYVHTCAHMQKLEKLPRVKSSNDINGLRKMYDQIEVCVRNLKAFIIAIATYGAILVPFLNGKLPSETRVILSRNFQNDI